MDIIEYAVQAAIEEEPSNQKRRHRRHPNKDP